MAQQRSQATFVPDALGGWPMPQPSTPPWRELPYQGVGILPGTTWDRLGAKPITVDVHLHATSNTLAEQARVAAAMHIPSTKILAGLKLRNLWMQSEAVSSLAVGLSAHPFLLRLDLDIQSYPLLDAIAQFPQLAQIKLSFSSTPTQQGFAQSFESARCMHVLQDTLFGLPKPILDLALAHIEPWQHPSLDAIFGAPKPVVRSVYLAPSLSDDGFAPLSDVLLPTVALQHTQYLRFSHRDPRASFWPMAHFNMACQNLAAWPKLKVAQFLHLTMTEENLYALAHAVQHHPSLVVLDLVMQWRITPLNDRAAFFYDFLQTALGPNTNRLLTISIFEDVDPAHTPQLTARQAELHQLIVSALWPRVKCQFKPMRNPGAASAVFEAVHVS